MWVTNSLFLTVFGNKQILSRILVMHYIRITSKHMAFLL